MKNSYIFAVLMCGLMLLTACVKEGLDEQPGIPAGAIMLTTESYTAPDKSKTSVLDETVQWENGDVVYFFNDNSGAYPQSVHVEGTTAYANVSSISGVKYCYYPSSLTNNGYRDNPTVSIQDKYECSVNVSGRQIIKLPMVAKAEADATTVQFKHISAAVKVMLKNSMGTNLYVDSVIVLTDNYGINGSRTINFEEADFAIPLASDAPAANRRVKVWFPEGFLVPSDSDNKSIQVPIAPIGADKMTIKVYCNDASDRYLYSYKPDSNVPALGRNKMLVARVDLNTAEGHYMTKSSHTIDLASLPNDLVNNLHRITRALDRDTFTCSSPVQTYNNSRIIKIPANATVTFNGINVEQHSFVGEGNYTIVLSGTNTINKGHTSSSINDRYNAAITVAAGYTVTIQGTGSLNATGHSNGAAIGSSSRIPCGNIRILGGTITAQGGSGSGAAGIGCGYGSANSCGTITISGGNVTAKGGNRAAGIGCCEGSGSCGDILINGGTVNATGSDGAAGIGTGNNSGSICGSITITSNVTAKKGVDATHSIGKGNSSSTCGTVKIGGTIYWDGSDYQNNGDTYLTTSPLTYTPTK